MTVHPTFPTLDPARFSLCDALDIAVLVQIGNGIAVQSDRVRL